MGGTLQRIEVLLVGLVVLFAGTVVVGFMLLRPASPTTYVHATPQSLVTSGGVRPTSAPATAPASAPVATAALAAARLPIPSAATPTTSAPQPTLIVPPVVKTVWLWLLMAVGLGGEALVILRMRKRRMTYKNQSVGQLLAAADDVTRTTNVRIMRGLAEQGMLTAELATAAGIDLKQPHKHASLRLPHLPLPHLTMPRLTLLRLRLPALRMPAMTWPKLCLRRRQRPRTIDRAPVSAASISLATAVTTLYAAPNSAERAPVLRGVLAAQALDLPAVEPPVASDAHADETDAWTAEDRALAVAGVLADIWAAANLSSLILGIDTASTVGNGQVIVTIDGHPDEEQRIADLPDLLIARRPAWRASWRRMGGSRTAPALVVDVVPNSVHPATGGPLLVPILAHGRGGKTTRFYPLASWQHLGLYGASALGALHAVLGSLLYNQPPSHMALAIIDHGEIAPLYRDVAHLFALPSAPRESIEILAQAIRRGARGEVRPLVLVAVEPDDILLNLLTGIVARLRTKPATPVHLLIVQEQLSVSGRELYAMLPALITSSGRGPTALLPGQGDWPKRDEARLIGRGVRLEGHAITLDETDIAALVAQLRGTPAGLLPVFWEAPAPGHGAFTPTRTALDERDDADANLLVEDDRWGDGKRVASKEPIEGAQPIKVEETHADELQLEEQIPMRGADDDQADLEAEQETSCAADNEGAQLRRLIAALVAARQRLMDAQDALPVRASANTLADLADKLSARADPHERADEDDAAAPHPLPSVAPIVVVTEPPAADDQPPAIMAVSAAIATAAAPVPDPTKLDATRIAPPPDIAATVYTSVSALTYEPAADTDAAATPVLLVTSGSEQTVGVFVPIAEQVAEPRSRRAALLRSTLDAGRADASLLQTVLPHQSEPRAADMSATAATPAAINRPPVERLPEPQPMVEPENGWPIGPAPLGRVAMAELMARVASAPTIIAGQPNEVGVTKNRLVDLLKGTYKAQAKELAESLMVWFDLAGMLVKPTKPGRLRHPRALVTTNLVEIAAQLSGTPCPDKTTVKALWALSNEGRD